MSSKVYLFILTVIFIITMLFFMFIGYHISISDNLIESMEKVDFFQLLFHNGIIVTIMILGTDILAIPVILINIVYNSIIFGALLQVYSFFQIISILPHVPLEFIFWILAVYIGCMLRLIIFQKKNVKYLKKMIGIEIILLLISTYIESRL